jgi:hypothetical protein
MIHYYAAESITRHDKLWTVLEPEPTLTNARLRRIVDNVVGFEDANAIPLANVEISSSGDVAVTSTEFS